MYSGYFSAHWVCDFLPISTRCGPRLIILVKYHAEIRLVNRNCGTHQFRFLSVKHTSPDLLRCTPLSSLIASIPRRSSNPNNCLSTIRASMVIGRACPMPTLILPYPQYFKVLPSTVKTSTYFCLQRWHAALLSTQSPPEPHPPGHRQISL